MECERDRTRTVTRLYLFPTKINGAWGWGLRRVKQEYTYNPDESILQHRYVQTWQTVDWADAPTPT